MWCVTIVLSLKQQLTGRVRGILHRSKSAPLRHTPQTRDRDLLMQ